MSILSFTSLLFLTTDRHRFTQIKSTEGGKPSPRPHFVAAYPFQRESPQRPLRTFHPCTSVSTCGQQKYFAMHYIISKVISRSVQNHLFKFIPYKLNNQWKKIPLSKKIPPEQIQRDFEQKTNYLRSPSSLMNAR